MIWWVVAIVVLGVAAYVLYQQHAAPRRIPDTAEEFLAAVAKADEGPGDIFGDGPGVRFPGPRARAWAYGVLYSAGTDADADPAYAATLLMRADSRLTRAHADALIRAML